MLFCFSRSCWRRKKTERGVEELSRGRKGGARCKRLRSRSWARLSSSRGAWTRLSSGPHPRWLASAAACRASIFEKCIFENFANFWRARSRLYQNEILQENMRSTSFFKLYKICILLHRCNLKILAKNRFEKSANFVKIQHFFFANVAKFTKFCQISKFLARNSGRF